MANDRNMLGTAVIDVLWFFILFLPPSSIKSISFSAYSSPVIRQ